MSIFTPLMYVVDSASFALDNSMFVVEKITNNVYRFDEEVFFMMGLVRNKHFFYCEVEGTGHYVIAKNTYNSPSGKSIKLTLSESNPYQYIESESWWFPNAPIEEGGHNVTINIYGDITVISDEDNYYDCELTVEEKIDLFGEY